MMQEAFEASGYDDWPVLEGLDEGDLDAIARIGNITLLPGHRKRILIAARLLGAGRTCTDEVRGGETEGFWRVKDFVKRQE